MNDPNRQYLKISQHIANSFYRRGAINRTHLEDMVQEGAMAMIDAIRRGVTEFRQLWQASQSAQYAYLRKESVRGMKGGAQAKERSLTISPESESQFDSSPFLEPAETADKVIEREQSLRAVREATLAAIHGKCPRGDKTRAAIVEWRLLADEPVTLIECANRLGLSQGVGRKGRHVSVWQAEKKMMNRIRDILEASGSF